jgi:hypothetical protein
LLWQIKPDGVQRGLVAEIISRFEKRGYKLVGARRSGRAGSGVGAHSALQRQAGGPFRKHAAARRAAPIAAAVAPLRAGEDHAQPLRRSARESASALARNTPTDALGCSCAAQR